MNPADRIRALQDKGHLLAHEARRLLDALDETLEQPLDDTLHETLEHGTDPDPQGPRDEPQPTPVLARWLTLNAAACSVDVHVDTQSREPRLDVQRGELHLQPRDDGWHVHQGDTEGNANTRPRILQHLQPAKATLTLPQDTGLHLDVTAGTLYVHDVPALTGRLNAGDVKAHGLRAVQLDVHVGDVDVHLDPHPGTHHLRLGVGDLDLHLPHDAHATLHGHVDIGDAHAPPPFQTQRRGLVAASIEGTTGTGAATLHASVGTGDLTLHQGEHHA